MLVSDQPEKNATPTQSNAAGPRESAVLGMNSNPQPERPQESAESPPFLLASRYEDYSSDEEER